MADNINTNPINYTQELTLDLNSNNAYTTVFAKQYDSARYLKIYLTKDNEEYEIDPSHNFYFRMRKPDGHGVINPAFVKLTTDEVVGGRQGYIMVQLTEQCLASAGRGYADLVEYDGNGSVLSSIPFILNVMSSPNLGDNITSNDEFQQLVEMVSQGEALLQNAPKINANGYWEQYSSYVPAGTSYYDNIAMTSSVGYTTSSVGATAYPSYGTISLNNIVYYVKLDSIGVATYTTDVRAAGSDGKDGVSAFIVDSYTGDPESQVVQASTSAVAAGITYYSDPSCVSSVGLTSKMLAVSFVDDNTYSFSSDSVLYYVKYEDVSFDDETHHYYVLTIPQGHQGIQGERGPEGPRGNPGLGGVTWVDGLTADNERRIESITPIPIENGYVSSASAEFGAINSRIKISLNSATGFTYASALDFVKVAFASSSASNAVSVTVSGDEVSYSTNLYSVDRWVAQDTADFNSLPPSELIIKSVVAFSSDDLAAIPSEFYLWGQQGEDSGNVKLFAVSYNSGQSSFIVHDEYGVPSVVEIDDTLRGYARANISAMKAVDGVDGDIMTYNSSWTAAKPWQVLHRLNYDELNAVVQNYSYTEVVAAASSS